MTDRLKQMVTADGTTIGLPELRAGSVVEIGSLGSRLNGRYFVEKTTHSFSDAGYTTKFTARRESPRSGS
jgi:phage protein D